MALAHLKEYLRPTSLNEALALLQKGGKNARLIGGGVDLVLHSSPAVDTLIDLCGLSLSYVKESAGGVAIGATSTMTEVLDHPAVTGYLGGVIARMLLQVGSPLLRNLATIGGSLVRANPWSDVIPLFLALDAQVTLFDGTVRSIPLSEFYLTCSHLSGWILTEVCLPSPAIRGTSAGGVAAAFHKFSRTAFDIALLNCACLVQVKANRCVRARIVAGGTPRLGAFLPAAQETLVGERLTDETIEQVARVAGKSAETRNDLRASAQYRRQLIYVGVKRCLHEIRVRLAEEG